MNEKPVTYTEAEWLIDEIIKVLGLKDVHKLTRAICMGLIGEYLQRITKEAQETTK